MSYKILYIDDEPIKRERISGKMEKAGFTVFAPEGNKTEDLKNETIEILKTNGDIFDLIVLDVLYGDYRLGGLKLYIGIEKKYAKRWKDVLVFTRLEMSGTTREIDEITNFLVDRRLKVSNVVTSESELINKMKSIL